MFDKYEYLSRDGEDLKYLFGEESPEHKRERQNKRIEELKEKTGNDVEVQEYVKSFKEKR